MGVSSSCNILTLLIVGRPKIILQIQSKGQYHITANYGDNERLPPVSVLNIAAVHLLCWILCCLDTTNYLWKCRQSLVLLAGKEKACWSICETIAGDSDAESHFSLLYRRNNFWHIHLHLLHLSHVTVPLSIMAIRRMESRVLFIFVCLGLRMTSIKLAAKSLHLERQGNKINRSYKLDFNIPLRL